MLDEWLEMLKNGRILAEKDLKQLCGKVNFILFYNLLSLKKLPLKKVMYSLFMRLL
jgi:hypothetical protein